MLSNTTAGIGGNLLHLGRARKKGPFPNFPQRGTPLISGLLFRPKSPSVENPSGGASVAYFFYSSSLGYFENILVQALDEGRDSLQPLCLEIFSNGFLLDEMHFVWQAGTLTSGFYYSQ
jgi:hypothetical protein